MEYALAAEISHVYVNEEEREGDTKRTLLFRLADELPHHGLDDTDVAVEETADGAANQGDPEVGGETDHDHAEHGSQTAEEQDGFAADAIG